MTNRLIALQLLTILLCSCGVRTQSSALPKEDLDSKQLLQGIWINDANDTPLMNIAGDTIYYTNAQNLPQTFKVFNDTLYMYGSEISKYAINQLDEYNFYFHAQSDNIIKLHRSENESDTLAFRHKGVEVIPTYTEFTKKDTIVTFEGVRYRAYVYVNPSKMKVIKTTSNEDGLSMENVYYDNVMHICVYEGKKSLYAKDITKQMFSKILPKNFLDKSILSDMDFVGIDKTGYRYQATLCIPESLGCNVVDLSISFEGELNLKFTQ